MNSGKQETKKQFIYFPTNSPTATQQIHTHDQKITVPKKEEETKQTYQAPLDTIGLNHDEGLLHIYSLKGLWVAALKIE